MPKTLDDYLALPYRLEIVPGERGEIFVQYPELPGCMTQVQRLEDVPEIAREILTGWLEIALEDGFPIPLPDERPTYAGKVLVRMPRSLHRRLAERAQGEGVSLNQYIVSLLSAAQADPGAFNQRMSEVEQKLDSLVALLTNGPAERPHNRVRRMS